VKEMMEDIFDEMRLMQEEMDRLFGRFFSTRPMLEHSKRKDIVTGSHFRSPIAEINETDNSVIARFELPGVDKKEINLNVTDNFIEVKAEKKTEKKKEDKDYSNYESISQHFYRRIPLSSSVKADSAKATYKDGILRVEIPKGKQIQKKRIQIE